MTTIPGSAYLCLISMASIIGIFAYFRYRKVLRKNPVKGAFWWKTALFCGYFALLAAFTKIMTVWAATLKHV